MITGLAGVTFGVERLDDAQRFVEDFGLTRRSASDREAHFVLEDGSSVTLKLADDPALPPPLHAERVNMREIVWGVDSAEALDQLAERLARDLAVSRDGDGSVSFVDPNGIATRLRVFDRKPVLNCPDQLNAPDAVKRLGRHRRWHRRARPKVIQHAVYAVDDALNAARFYMQKLDFRLSDVSDGFGYFLRAPGTSEHHSIFFFQAGVLPTTPKARPEHIAFGVEDIDEMMVGAGHMDAKGWQKAMGPGRHRIGSALFYYIKTPFGIEMEYGTDNDHLDDQWQPMLWNQRFGFLTWLADAPVFLKQEPEWSVAFVPQDHPVYAAWQPAA